VHEDAELVDGDRAVQILKFSGTHAGEFFGLPASGRRVEIVMACVLTFRDGLITEERRIYDFTGMLVQVGVLKAKPQG
jgi:predicted ester cyclase